MVFCYKLITESPRCSTFISPRRNSKCKRTKKPTSSIISELLGSFSYGIVPSSDLLGSIPHTDLKLLAVLARKREEDKERERLADDFRRLWQKEDEISKTVRAEITGQYQRYINKKREEERRLHEMKQLQRSMEFVSHRGQLIDFIKHKEMRSADLLACADDIKTTNLMRKAMEEEGRTHLALRRKATQDEIDDWHRQIDLLTAQRKVDGARKRRSTRLRDVCQRAAITNALNSWESSKLRQEIDAMDAAKRASLVHRLAYDDERSHRFMYQKDRSIREKRKIASLTARLREEVRQSRL